MDKEVILSAEGLSVQYKSSGIRIEDVNFSISRGNVLGLFGESGSGKTTVCNAILGLLGDGAACLEGSVRLLGNEILPLAWDARERINGKEIGIIMQNPMASFDPCMRIRGHFEETFCAHLSCSKRDADLYGMKTLRKAGLKDEKRIMNSYPHQLSGGTLQRVMIAIAIALNPVLIIADEPTTALDRSSQGIVLELLDFVMQEYRPAMLLVSHDIEVMAALADEVAVMKEGRIVEHGSYDSIVFHPNQDYTRELISAARMMEVNWCYP